LYPAEIALIPDADAVVLIGELSASHCVVVETPYTSTNGRVVLQTTLIRSTNAATMNLGNAYAPQSRETGAGYDRQHNGIALAQTRINVH